MYYFEVLNYYGYMKFMIITDLQNVLVYRKYTPKYWK